MFSRMDTLQQEQDIARLINSSRKVFEDCSLPGGAIIAAPSHKSYYPSQAKDYAYVWPRDAFFICRAARLVGLDLYEGFFSWCEKAEGFKETGLFYEKYHPDGRKAREHFQPDQTASVLLALQDYCDAPGKVRKYQGLIRACAQGLLRVWDKDHFSLVSQDLWEERLCFPDMPEGFTYSVAMCAAGLRAASSLLGDDRYEDVAGQMREAVLAGNPDHFSRTYGPLRDERVDASLLGLVWPAALVPADDVRMRATVALIRERLRSAGVHRYEHDEYDGWMFGAHNRKKGAGWWPLLEAWLGLYYVAVGERGLAQESLRTVLSSMDEHGFLPEQVFADGLRQGVSPLCWSHAMALLLAHRLGLL